ncbi:hypothetical protein GCM10020367_08620 [Streptomyces sannanensis]|uniref:Secreted protein n=1 Tax=Streptomyces sannanensis TaxID=285536 RepID=A0ABP6S5R9_9ACTN
MAFLTFATGIVIAAVSPPAHAESSDAGPTVTGLLDSAEELGEILDHNHAGESDSTATATP